MSHRIPLAMMLLSLASGASALRPELQTSQYQVQCYGVADGLPQGSVQAILQLPDGALLLGTNRGVVRFDGARAAPLLIGGSPALGNVQVHRLARFEDEVWVATFDGLYRWRANTLDHYTQKNGLPQDRVTAVLPTSEGAYVGTHGGSVFLPRESAGFGPAQPLGDMRTSDFDFDPDGRLWAAALDGVWRRGLDGTWTTLTQVDNGGIYWSTLRDASGIRWLGARTRLAQLDGESLKTVSAQQGLPAQPVRAILQDRDRQLWFATAGAGLYRLQGERFERVPGLRSDVVFALQEDNEGNLWAGTSSGVCRVRDGAMMNFGLAEGIGTDFVLSIHAASNGSTYVGSNGRGLYAITDGAVKALGNPGGDPFVNLITGIGDRLLVTSNAGSFFYEKPSFTPVHPALGNRQIAWAALDDDGVLWFRSGVKPLERLVGDTLTEQPLGDDGGPSRWGFRGRDGAVWLTTTKALYRARGAEVRQQLALPPSPVAACQIQDSRGIVWCTSSDGVLRVDVKAQRVQVIRDPTMGQLALLALLEDQAGGLWIASTAGLFYASFDDLDAAANGGPANLRRFDERHGMRSSEFARAYAPGLASAGADGQHWWATLGGVLKTHPQRLIEVRTPPSLAIVRLRADGGVVPESAWHQLPPDVVNIDIDFSARSLTDAASLQLRHRLLPLSEEWSETQGRQFSALGLPSGRYRFELQATLDRRQWQTVASEFTIQPHWYQRWWARAAFVAFGVLLVIAIPVLRIAHLRRRAAELSHLVEERTAALHVANRRLDQIARTDALTGIANRRRFDEAMVELSKQAPQPVALLLADVDHFKRYNDSRGHPAGDECLRLVAGAMRSVLPESGALLARYGGEEFAVLLVGPSNPQQLADQLRNAVRALALPHESNPPDGIVTISIGLATSSGLGETGEHLLHRADHALYSAKSTGRDRVCSG
jgi:diguanylate cyclase (GGDEF)-like protein